MSSKTATMAPTSAAQEAAAALHAVSAQAMADNLAFVANLSEGGDAAHVAEHIRGMVAVTMGHLSADAPAVTRNNAKQWQDWALGVADRVALPVTAKV